MGKVAKIREARTLVESSSRSFNAEGRVADLVEAVRNIGTKLDEQLYVIAQLERMVHPEHFGESRTLYEAALERHGGLAVMLRDLEANIDDTIRDASGASVTSIDAAAEE